MKISATTKESYRPVVERAVEGYARVCHDERRRILASAFTLTTFRQAYKRHMDLLDLPPADVAINLLGVLPYVEPSSKDPGLYLYCPDR